jgi:hypothetical protein
MLLIGHKIVYIESNLHQLFSNTVIGMYEKDLKYQLCLQKLYVKNVHYFL